jgi:DNA-binding NarL/FixJ family response regulator
MNPPSPGDQTIDVLVAEQYAYVRRDFRAALATHPEISVVAEAADSAGAVAACQQFRPQVAVMDFALTGAGGLETARRISALGQGTKMLLTGSPSAGDETEYLLRALQAGAAGYLQIADANRDPAPAIHTVQGGRAFLYSSAVQFFLSHYPLTSSESSRVPELMRSGLSVDELWLLRYTTEGADAVEIAHRLQRGPSRVREQQHELLAKLGLAQPTALLRYAEQYGLFRPEPWG